MNEIITTLFEEFVTAGPKDNSKLEAVVHAFLDCMTAPSMYESGEANDCFNAILSGCTSPPLFIGGLKEAHRAHCTAAVLYGISRRAKNDLNKLLGWKALNSDAKGWCCNVLECELSANAPEPVLRELLLAKSLVGRLADDAGLLPTTPREPLPRVDPTQVVEKPVDE